MTASTKTPTTNTKRTLIQTGKRVSSQSVALEEDSSALEKFHSMMQEPLRSTIQTVDFDQLDNLEDCVKAIHDATPMEMVEIERRGVNGAFIVELSKKMDIPTKRIVKFLGIPPATASRKSALEQNMDGRSGLALIGMIKIISIAQDIVNESTAEQAKDFDVEKWLGQWIERPQPALGGKKPAEYLDTPTGVEIVSKLLGAIYSGAYL
jgi:putative toxin-antitoxin system antitoxin component (TIGR02293 family)